MHGAFKPFGVIAHNSLIVYVNPQLRKALRYKLGVCINNVS